MPAIAAGGSFAMTTLAGLALGIWIGGRTGQGLWALAGLFGGLVVGSYAAYRLLMRSL
ncbi:MAG TPA: hypothetical protein VKB39_10460 [Candidatus Baltobacteraceae bacterium]|nr:hypothetical protein [Candidatus Baltobacteraceae bacterium]